MNSMGIDIRDWDPARNNEALVETALQVLRRAWAQTNGGADHIETREVVNAPESKPMLRITWAAPKIVSARKVDQLEKLRG